MKVIIDIPEDTYNYITSRCKYQNKDDSGLSEFEKAGIAIKNGTPLPEGHGRLIDADALIKGIEEYLIKYPEDREDDKQNQMVEWICLDVDNAPTIIEAAKGE